MWLGISGTFFNKGIFQKQKEGVDLVEQLINGSASILMIISSLSYSAHDIADSLLLVLPMPCAKIKPATTRPATTLAPVRWATCGSLSSPTDLNFGGGIWQVSAG